MECSAIWAHHWVGQSGRGHTLEFRGADGVGAEGELDLLPFDEGLRVAGLGDGIRHFGVPVIRGIQDTKCQARLVTYGRHFIDVEAVK